MRAREIDRWAQSQQYRALLAANQSASVPVAGGSAAQQRAIPAAQ
jgi:hypothetical protein